jgi:DUF971 family protein
MQRNPFESVKPVHIGWTDDGKVQIVWDDAHQSRFDLPFLREHCPCATCQGTHGPPTTLVRQSRGGLPIVQTARPKAQPSVEVKSVVPVGHYAIRFTWGDGHDGGLYSWRYLRTLSAGQTEDLTATG